MSTIADVELPSEEFSLGPSLTGTDGAEFEIVRVAAHSEDDVVPYVRVRGSDLDEVHDAILTDETVSEAVPVDDLDDERLYRMRWSERARIVAYVLLDAGTTIPDMHGSGDR